jgi:hypothetical protein
VKAFLAKTTVYLLWVVILGVVAPVARAADAQDPPLGVFSDEWFAIMLNGHKSGHMHSTMERCKGDGPGRDIIRTMTQMTMTAGRTDSTITVTVTQSTEETLAGEPRAFEQVMKLGAIPSTTSGRIKDGKVTVTTTQFGQKGAPATYKLPEGAMMSWAVYREQLKRGLTPGTKYTLSMYEPTMAVDKLSPATIEIGGKEEIDLFGRKVQAIRTTQTVKIKGLLGFETPVETVTWMEEDGTAVRMEMSMMNIPIELIACSKTIAQRPDDPADLMDKTLIAVKAPINADVPSLTYRLKWTGKGSGTEPSIPETGMQRIVKKSASEYVLKVTRISAQPVRKETLSKEDRERYLAASQVVNYKDPIVAELARKAAGGEKDPRQLADRLRRFVGDYIQTKNLSVGFGSASEVARSKEGDCTEHGVLLAALGRAVGIPTRLVTGIVYTDQFATRRNVFVGHLWTQFWIDGRWVDVDAALRQTDVDPTHIALGLSAATDNGVADMVGSLWLAMGNFSIEVLDAKNAQTQAAR